MAIGLKPEGIAFHLRYLVLPSRELLRSLDKPALRRLAIIDPYLGCSEPAASGQGK